ncbi:MAG: anti-sigma factor antagonist [Mycobacterium sp.]|nr:anti-sigma factor antagonist [Mycobacterium sp.]
MTGYGNPAIICGGAQIRVQCRHLATVVTIAGVLDASNAEQAMSATRRFVIAEKPVVLDLTAVVSPADDYLPLLEFLDDTCHAAGVEWLLVTSPAVASQVRIGEDTAAGVGIANSVPEALQWLADGVTLRRRLLLSVLHRSA